MVKYTFFFNYLSSEMDKKIIGYTEQHKLNYIKQGEINGEI